MTEADAPPPLWRRPAFGHLCELVALCGLTVAQPVLDSFAGSPETFVLRRATTTDIVLFAVVVTLALPVGLWLVEQAVGLAHPTARRATHGAFLAGLFGLAGWQLVERHTTAGVAPHVAAAVGLAALGTAAVLRYRPPRTVLRLLALSPLVVATLWLGTGRVHDVAFSRGPDTAQGLPIGDPAPIVMVVFDELPVASLLDDDGGIDATLWPGFARLARDATWYPNTTSVSPTTPEAVPAILTGRYPGALDVPPTAANHPDNLFRALQGSYELNVWELVAQLCPPRQCPAFGGTVHQGLPALLADAADVWRDYLSRPAQGEEEPFAIRQSDPEAPAKFERFIASLDDTPERRLDFLHIALPHQPWRHLPSGARHDAPFLAEGLGEPNYSWTSDFVAAAGRQRHLLQLQRADDLLARMLQRLDDLDRYDESLIVVTADHGVAFDRGEPIRGLSAGNAEQIMWVPLFVKAPHQEAGAVDERPLETVDIVPTIADILDLDLPWPVDGTAASVPRTAADETRRFYSWARNELVPTEGDHVEIDGAEVYPRVFEVPTPGGEPRDDLQLYRFGPLGHLVGREVRELEVAEPAGSTVAFLDADGQRVGPEHFEVDLAEEVLPVYVRGERADLGLFDDDETNPVLLTVNGFVAGWGEWLVRDGEERFFVLAPHALFAAGPNELAVYEVTGEPDDPVLHPLALTWA